MGNGEEKKTTGAGGGAPLSGVSNRLAPNSLSLFLSQSLSSPSIVDKSSHLSPWRRF